MILRLPGLISTFRTELERHPESQPEAFIDHAVEVRLWDFLKLYMHEALMTSGLDSQIQYLNPLMVYHNLFMTQNANSIMSLGFNLVPLRAMSLRRIRYGPVSDRAGA